MVRGCSLGIGSAFVEYHISPPRRDKYPYSEFFWSVFSRIRTEYGEILCISLYSAQMRENMDLKTFEYGNLSHSAHVLITFFAGWYVLKSSPAGSEQLKGTLDKEGALYPHHFFINNAKMFE